MRKVVLYTLVSLDGGVDHPSRYFLPVDPEAPGPPVFDPVMASIEERVIATQDAVLVGRGMYDEWAGYWPSSDVQPFADFINRVKKYVVTSTPLTRPCANAEAVHGRLADVVRGLKARPGRDIGVHGSIRLAQSLFDGGLVDELQLAVGPVVDPEGRRLFVGSAGSRRLELLSADPTPSGCVWLHYRAG